MKQIPYGRSDWQKGRISLSLAAIAALALSSVGAMGQPQSQGPADASKPLHAVALLFHGPYGEGSYAVVEEASDSVTIEDPDTRLRITVRRAAGEACTFLATHRFPDGVIVEKLDFTKFDGKHELREACAATDNSIFATLCTDTLHFGRPDGYCQVVLPDAATTDFRQVQFPDGACRPFIVGPRRRQFQLKYIDAFDAVYAQCGGKQ